MGVMVYGRDVSEVKTSECKVLPRENGLSIDCGAL